MKTYAYVTTESCTVPRAKLPGSFHGEIPIHRASDYSPWPYGKRETIRLVRGDHFAQLGTTPERARYLRTAAITVSRLLGWTYL